MLYRPSSRVRGSASPTSLARRYCLNVVGAASLARRPWLDATGRYRCPEPSHPNRCMGSLTTPACVTPPARITSAAFLGDHDDRGVGVARHHRRHDRGVDHAQMLQRPSRAASVSTTAIGPGPIMQVLVWWKVVPAVARTWFSRSSSVVACGPGSIPRPSRIAASPRWRRCGARLSGRRRWCPCRAASTGSSAASPAASSDRAR